jgi:hypothetical protein
MVGSQVNIVKIRMKTGLPLDGHRNLPPGRDIIPFAIAMNRPERAFLCPVV